MYKREKIFAELLTKQDRKWQYPAPRFEIGKTHYRPDFFLPKENLYIEVVGTRQAYHANKNKMFKLKQLYPHIRLLIVDYKNNPYPPIEGKRRGRKKLFKEKGVQFQLRFDKNLYNRINNFVHKRRKQDRTYSMAEFVRQALREEFREKGV